MNRFIIGSLWGRTNRNGINSNFEYLFEGSKRVDALNSRADSILRKSDTTLNEAQKTNDLNKDVQRQINNLILSDGESDAEVIQARGTHTTLNDRLNEFNTFVGDASILGDNYRSISESLIELGANVRNFGAKGDGTSDDTQAFKNAADYIGEGVVIIPSGTYIIQGLPMRKGLYYKGAGMHATILTLPENATDHMFKADAGLTDILSGAVEGVSLRGTKSGVTSSYNAFDFSSLSRLERFTIRDVKAEYFDIGYNGTVNDRWAYITNTQFYSNRVAIYAGEHPILVNVDCRGNDIGLTGRLNDLTALNCRFNYNRIGAEPAEGAGNYISNSIFQNTGFWANSEKAIELNDGNLFTSTRMAALNTATNDKCIVINGSKNIISFTLFGQSESTAFDNGYISFEGERNNGNNMIVNNTFNLAGGPGIVAHPTKTTHNNVFSSNTAYSNGVNMHPFIKSNTTQIFRTNSIKDNHFDIGKPFPGSLIEIPYVYSGGNNISDNTFIMNAATKMKYVLDIDARSTKITDNFFTTHSQSEYLGFINEKNRNDETIIKDNKGIAETSEVLRANGLATIPAGVFHVIVPVTVDKPLTKKSIKVTPFADLGAGGRFWVDYVTASQFYIYRVGNTDNDIEFNWEVDLT